MLWTHARDTSFLVITVFVVEIEGLVVAESFAAVSDEVVEVAQIALP